MARDVSLMILKAASNCCLKNLQTSKIQHSINIWWIFSFAKLFLFYIWLYSLIWWSSQMVNTKLISSKFILCSPSHEMWHQCWYATHCECSIVLVIAHVQMHKHSEPLQTSTNFNSILKVQQNWNLNVYGNSTKKK